MKHIFELQMSRLNKVSSPAMCRCIDEAGMEWLFNSNAYKLASFVLIYALILVFGCSFDHLLGLSIFGVLSVHFVWAFLYITITKSDHTSSVYLFTTFFDSCLMIALSLTASVLDPFYLAL